MKRNNKKGFTIVELVIVIAVIAILAGVLIPTFSGIVNKAKLNAALQEAKTIMTNYTASIDYTEATPEDKYYIAVEQDKDDGTFYVFTVEKGVISAKPQEKVSTANLPTDELLVKADTNNDGWPETTPAESENSGD